MPRLEVSVPPGEPTLAEFAYDYGDQLAREANDTINRSDALRHELDEGMAAFEKTLRDVQDGLRGST